MLSMGDGNIRRDTGETNHNMTPTVQLLHTQNLFRLLDKKSSMTTADRITETCDELKTMLLKKNESYGDSALSPIRVFSKLEAEAGLKIRIDDKLSRLMRGNDSFNEDTVLDLLGYLILLRITQTGLPSHQKK